MKATSEGRQHHFLTSDLWLLKKAGLPSWRRSGRKKRLPNDQVPRSSLSLEVTLYMRHK
ncbi:hypothetical protein [Biomaibacter acetigenes]|uniref:hypothetical protein n=1 Tax=Biomaibacter acetigenes TaxID=2316383 RepID=UPI0013CEB242|nr:hypothetical protein [Biomaibacter acetigenes]